MDEDTIDPEQTMALTGCDTAHVRDLYPDYYSDAESTERRIGEYYTWREEMEAIHSKIYSEHLAKADFSTESDSKEEHLLDDKDVGDENDVILSSNLCSEVISVDKEKQKATDNAITLAKDERSKRWISDVGRQLVKSITFNGTTIYDNSEQPKSTSSMLPDDFTQVKVAKPKKLKKKNKKKAKKNIGEDLAKNKELNAIKHMLFDDGSKDDLVKMLATTGNMLPDYSTALTIVQKKPTYKEYLTKYKLLPDRFNNYADVSAHYVLVKKNTVQTRNTILMDDLICECIDENIRESITCTICLDIMQVPKTFTCGHTTCEKCVKNINSTSRDIWFSYSTSVNVDCPICRTPTRNTKVVTNFSIKNIVGNIKIRCENNKCEWLGCINTYEFHKSRCGEAETICSWCNIPMENKYLNSHIREDCSHRKVTCDICAKEGAWEMLKQHKELYCSKYDLNTDIKVTNGRSNCVYCDKTMMFNEMDNHIKTTCMSYYRHDYDYATSAFNRLPDYGQMKGRAPRNSSHVQLPREPVVVDLLDQAQSHVDRVARCRLELLSRQAPEGRSMEGGLRLGEMENDTIQQHGGINMYSFALSPERYQPSGTPYPSTRLSYEIPSIRWSNLSQEITDN